jgi:hypothetical protein
VPASWVLATESRGEAAGRIESGFADVLTAAAGGGGAAEGTLSSAPARRHEETATRASQSAHTSALPADFRALMGTVDILRRATGVDITRRRGDMAESIPATSMPGLSLCASPAERGRRSGA